MNNEGRMALLNEKRSQISLGGGAEKIKKQHDAGKKTARERINALLDENSFVEVNAFAKTRSIDFDMQKKKVPGDGVVTGYGSINGRLVFISSQDFTVIGGSLEKCMLRKLLMLWIWQLKQGHHL